MRSKCDLDRGTLVVVSFRPRTPLQIRVWGVAIAVWWPWPVLPSLPLPHLPGGG